MCYPEIYIRLHPDGKIASGLEKHDIDYQSKLTQYEDIHDDNVLALNTGEQVNTMNTGDDETTSVLNGRLRPRKSITTIPNPVSRSSRKPEPKTTDKHKRNNTPSKTPPNRSDDLAKAHCSPELCPYCDRKFASKLSASKHARRIHLSTSKQDNFIKCLYCNLSEGNPHEVFRHMVDSHPNQYFACLDCHTRFPSTTELAEHKLNVCEKQKAPYRSKLRQKHSHNSTRNKKKFNVDQKDKFSNENKEYSNDKKFNGIVISCELKPSQIQDAADIEDNITTNLILPPGKTLANTNLERNAVIVLDDVQWNKRITPNFTFHSTDADQILSRLGVVHRSPRVGESTRRAWLKMLDENNPKFEKCFDTNFYTRVASNVQENLTRFLDGSFNFNPDAESTIKTRKSKSSVIINTAEGFPILLAYEQISRHVLDGYMPRQLAPRHKWKWDTTENADNALVDPNAIKSDSHVNNCIVTLVSSLDIWTQICMRRKYEDVLNKTSSEKTDINTIIASELKEILESREIPASSSHVVKYTKSPVVPPKGRPELPSYLGLSPVEPKCELQPAVLSGEWVRPRCYVCCACGAQTRDARGLTSHMSTQHPLAQVQHYEIVGEPLLNADIFKHLYIPPNMSSSRTRPPRGFRDCTKCKKSIALEDMHQHMLDCAGDTPAVRRKCRNRPFGVRRRRPRLPDNTIRKKIRKEIRSRHKQKGRMRSRAKIRTEVGDAETIRKMIADLPAKRVRVSLNSTLNLKTRKVIENKRNKLRIKRQTADGGQNIVTRSKKVNGVNTSVETQSEDDDEPLKPTHRNITVKKRPRTLTASSKTFNKTGNVNLNATEENVRQHGDRNKNTNHQRGGKDVGGSGNKDDENENNVSHGQETPLKHSIARLTSNEKIQLISHVQDLPSVEKNNIKLKDASTDTLRQFEDITRSDKLDKPPLQDGSKTVDPGGLQKSKLNKPRRRLNDCIAMLMQKTSQAQENQFTSEFEISTQTLLSDRDSAKSTTPNTEVPELHSAKLPKEKGIGPSLGASPTGEGSVSQVSNLDQSVVADSQYQLPNSTMFPQIVESNWMTRLTTEAIHLETIRQHNLLPYGGQVPSVANVNERRRSHGDPDFAPPRMTRNGSSKRRSTRLKSDTRDYQFRPQYPGIQPLLGIMPPPYGDVYDVSYGNMRRSSYDGSLLLPINQPLYHSHFLPGAANTLNIPMIGNPMENQYILPVENNETNVRSQLTPDLIQNSESDIASQSPARRKQRRSTSSEATISSDYESSQIYSQRKSPDGRGVSRGQVNNNYIVRSDATPKLSPRYPRHVRQPPASLRSHCETRKNVNALHSDIHVQRQRNDSSEFEYGIDRVSGSYYPSRDIDNSSISPTSYERSKKPEMFRSRLPSKTNDNTSLMEPSTSIFYGKPLYNFEDKLVNSSEYFSSEYERRSHFTESEEKNNIMNVTPELVCHPPLTETERVVIRESPTRHNVEDIINVAQSPQQLTKMTRTHEEIPTSDMVPLDLRPQHKIMSEVSQKSQPRLNIRHISELTGFAPSPMEKNLANESAKFKTRSQNVQDDLPLDLYKTSMYSQPSSSGLSVQPTMTDLHEGEADNSYDNNSVLDSNAALQPTIPTITLSPPEDENNVKKTDYYPPSQIKSISIQETNLIESNNKNTANIQVDILKSQTPPYGPNDAVTLKHKKAQTTDKRKLVPKEIIAVIDDLPQEQRDRLLDILPQFVRMSDLQSEASDELVNNEGQTNKHITTVSSAESPKATPNTSACSLTINTNLMPAPSSVIPKKRHSPNVTYSSQLNVSSTDVICSTNSLVKPVHPPTVQDVTPVGTKRDFIRNTEQVTNMETTLIDPYTGLKKSNIEFPSRESNKKNNECATLITDTNLDKRLEVPISLEPIKTPVKSRNSREKTSILRKVRFNSPRKSLSDDKQSNVKCKATQQKDTVHQKIFEEDLNNVQYTVDVRCETTPAANETLRLDQSDASYKEPLNDSSAPVTNDSGKEADIDKLVDEQNAEVNSHHLKFTLDDFLESKTSLTTGGPNKNVPTQEICDSVPSHKTDLANGSTLQAYNAGNLAVQDCAQNKSIEPIIEKPSTAPMDVPLENETIECLKSIKPSSDIIKIQKIDTLTEVTKENEFDSDDEDVSLADIAKLRLPKRKVISSAKSSIVNKHEKAKTSKKNKTTKKGKLKKSTNNVENTSALSGANKTTNRNRRTKILSNASCDFISEEISSNGKLKQQDGFIKFTALVDEVTETNPKHFLPPKQELPLNKNFDIGDKKKTVNIEQIENSNQSANNNHSEENANETIDVMYKSSKQSSKLQGANDEAVENMILNKTDVIKNEIILPKAKQDCERIEKLNSSFVEEFSDNISTDIESARSYKITENISQIPIINDTEKDCVVTHKRLLTKKQLIFSKMLCDDETVTLTNDKYSDTTNDVSSTVSLPSTSHNVMIKRKPIKRRKSSQGKRKNKRHMKVLNVQSEYESDTSQYEQEILPKGKHPNNKKEDPNNCIQKSTPQDNFTDQVDAILSDKQSPTSGKRTSDMNVSIKPKKKKLVDTETVDGDYQEIITENTPEAREPVTVGTKNENILNIKFKENTTSENRKRLDASLVPETRTTCYNRQIDYKPNRPSISTTKDIVNYDPYDIDHDEIIAITEPSAKKTKHEGSPRRSLHTARSNSPMPIIQSHTNSSDSESSKSDVPLQKYVEEKQKQLQKSSGQPLLVPPLQQSKQRLEQQQPNNDQEIIDEPDGAVDSLNVSETAATANTLEIFYYIDMNGAEKAKAVFIPEEELHTASLKKETESSENNNKQQDASQSTSAKTQAEFIDQAEKPSEAGNEDVLPNISEINKCQLHKESNYSEERQKGKVNNKNVDSNEFANIEDNIGIKDNGVIRAYKELDVKIKNDITKIKEVKKITDKESEGLEETIEKEIKESKEIKQSQGCKTSKENKMSKGSKSGLECRENTETKDVKEKKPRRSNQPSSVDNNIIKTPEQTNTDKYLENFGFYPERTPRKSNLLAIKKITETMHIINEGDDDTVYCKDRPTKKSHKETRKSSEGEISIKITQGTLKTIVDTTEPTKTNDDELQMTEKISEKEHTKDVKNCHDLENKTVIEAREETVSVPSKEDDSQHTLNIGESTLHEETPLNILSPIEDNDIEHGNMETKKSNKNKVQKIRPPGYKEKMYPDIEEFDLFEDKFDKIKRKSRTQAAAAKQTNAVDAVLCSSRASKKTEKRKKKYAKKSYHSTVVPTKGALKGFDSIKLSYSSQNNVAPSEAPKQKKRKRSNSKKKRERKDSDSSSKYDSDTNLKGVSVQERDIYEFKDNDDTELLGLRPSTVMDRFRSLNKEKSKHKEKCKDKDNKGKPLEGSNEDDDVKKLNQFDDTHSRDYDSKSTNIGHEIDPCYSQENYKFNDEILSGSVEKMEGPSNSKDAMSCHNFSQDDGLSRNISIDDEAAKLEDDEDDDDDDDDDNVCLVSRSRFVPPTNDDSSFEWNGSPESGFVHMSDGIDCNCLPDPKLDNDTETICDSSSCIFRKPNPEKSAVMGKIFKNNAVRREANDSNTDISPKADLDQLFDSLLETNSNDVSSEQNISSKNNREISPIPGPSSKLYTSYDSDIPLPTSPREHLKSQTSYSTRIGKRDKKSRSRDADDPFSRLLNKEKTLHTPPYVTPPKIDEDSISNNDYLYRQCILTHNEDACSSDSTEHSNNVGLVDEYVMMCSKNTQTEDPDTIVEDITTKRKSCSDDDESDLESESNDIIVLRRYASTKSHGAQTEDVLEEYYSDYEELVPQPGDYSMVTNKSTQTRKHKSKSKHNDDTSEDELFNALEKTKITLKKFVATTTKWTQTEHKSKSRKTLKNEDSTLRVSEPSTSQEKITEKKKKKVHKTETKVRDDSGDESSAKEDDGIDTTLSKDQLEPVRNKPESQSSDRTTQDYVYLDSSEYDAGVARQRARRKCTVGKQNVLAEHWSSESEAEASAPRPSVSCAKRGRKKSSAKRRVHVESEEGRAPRSFGPTIRARSSFNSDNEEEGGTQPQHGWIVGDSHKKLVTLLANAKGGKKSSHGHEKRHTAPDD